MRKARSRVFRMLKLRLHSEHEIVSKLEKNHFSQEIINQTVGYFKDLQFIDDRLFAQKWIESRLLKPFGFIRIAFELKNKGIHQDIIDEEITKYKDEYPETEAVCDLAKKRAHKYRNLEPEKIKQRVYGYLSRRGFSPNTIYKAIQDL